MRKFVMLIILCWSKLGRVGKCIAGVVTALVMGLTGLESMFGDAPFVQDAKEEYLWSWLEEEPECSLEWFQGISSVEERMRELFLCESRTGEDEDVREWFVDEAMESDNGVQAAVLAKYFDPTTPWLVSGEGKVRAPDLLRAVQLYGRALDSGVSDDDLLEANLNIACNMLNRSDFLHERLFQARCNVRGVSIWRYLDERSAQLAESAVHQALRSVVVGEPLVWANDENRGGIAVGSVTILRDAQGEDGKACREYSLLVLVAGYSDTMSGTACVDANERWTAMPSNWKPGFASVTTPSSGLVTLNKGENCEYKAHKTGPGHHVFHSVALECSEEATGTAPNFVVVCNQWGTTARLGEVGSSETLAEGIFYWTIGFLSLPEGTIEDPRVGDKVAVHLNLGNEALTLQAELGDPSLGIEFRPHGSLPEDVDVIHSEIGWREDWSSPEEITKRPIEESFRLVWGESAAQQLAKALAAKTTVQWRIEEFTGTMMPGPKDSEAARKFVKGCDAVLWERLSIDGLVQ